MPTCATAVANITKNDSQLFGILFPNADYLFYSIQFNFEKLTATLAKTIVIITAAIVIS